MSIFIRDGVFLQRVEALDNVHVIIKLIKMGNHPVTHAFINAPTLILHLTNNGDILRLDFDPWSDINVTPDQSIDERDLTLITSLAHAYYHQSIIDSEQAGYLYHLPADPPERRVAVEVLAFDDDQQVYSSDVFETRSLGAGAGFHGIRRNPQTGTPFDYGAELEKVIGAFITLKL